ncbi:probable serine/threonine-protein kinase irlC [Dendronephthya gigantea]|uniref:probable serine/threonine-protein kinase irlC n=1 Tax=Dendronephthya gigantea TaxID=151771 RepID=UPI00106D4DFB|nr:probable serine/threonine-protein kinase irlC [Dendronephthya gigantea]
MSVKHRERLEKLKQNSLNDSKSKAISPVKHFSRDQSFLLGRGSGGTFVYLGLMEDGSEVAIKTMLLQPPPETAENEKNILSLIQTKNSRFVVNYRHYFRDETFVYLVTDLCEETLKDHVLSRSIDDLKKKGRRMIKEILTGLQFLHDQGILHRDLKPSNVLVDIGGHMRLADFGISRVLKADETTVYTNAKGTPGWMPAEIIEAIGQKVESRYKKKSDIQVTGMIAFFILTKGDHPFGPTHDRMGNIVKGKPVNLKVLNDKSARKFVKKLICHKIKKNHYFLNLLVEEHN